MNEKIKNFYEKHEKAVKGAIAVASLAAGLIAVYEIKKGVGNALKDIELDEKDQLIKEKLLNFTKDLKANGLITKGDEVTIIERKGSKKAHSVTLLNPSDLLQGAYIDNNDGTIKYYNS